MNGFYFKKWLSSASRAFAFCSVINRVLIIVLRGSPSQIFQLVIRWISVWKMASLHPFWALASEGSQDKSVNKTHFIPWVKANHEPAFVLRRI